MSREDPQFKLRMSAELRAQAEQAAKAAGRSLNAELVARIEASFLGESTSHLLPASRAKELALMARESIPNEIRNRVIRAIAQAIKLGHSEAFASLEDLELEAGIPEEELETLLNDVARELIKAGYEVNHDDINSLWIKF
jgi:hypothetical protein